MTSVTNKQSLNSHVSTGASATPDEAFTRVPNGTSAGTADPPANLDAPAGPMNGSLRAPLPQPPVAVPPGRRYRK